MARYTGPKEKIERRLGKKISLKGTRSLSPKSATVKRMYPPGMHGKKFARKSSEYGQQLRSKQTVRNMYRMLEKQFKNWAKEAIASEAETTHTMVRRLESRLDNVVYRSGIGQSRDQARQLVNHGHILVNKKKVGIASYGVKVKDTISIREGSQKSKFFASQVPQWIKSYQAPSWLLLNPDTLVVTVQALPTIEESGIDLADIQSIIEFYSR